MKRPGTCFLTSYTEEVSFHQSTPSAIEKKVNIKSSAHRSVRQSFAIQFGCNSLKTINKGKQTNVHVMFTINPFHVHIPRSC